MYVSMTDLRYKLLFGDAGITFGWFGVPTD
jgi:hypothetical protein